MSWMPMEASIPLLDFFRCEIEAEERGDFVRLARVPDSHVMARLGYYRSLTHGDREGFRDYGAHWAAACYGFVIGAPRIDPTPHPLYERWRAAGSDMRVALRRSVPLLRAVVQQYKIDAARGVPSSVSKEELEVASSVRSIKAPELRKRVRAALKPLGYHKRDEIGYYHCRLEEREFRVHVDYGGRSAQLRYCVSMPEFRDVHPLRQFCLECALGFGTGDWDFIVEENVDDALSLFGDVIVYCVALPDRIRAACA